MSLRNSGSDLRTAYVKVEGLGSAKSGASHWLSFRLISMALIPLNLWLVISLIMHIGVYHIIMVEWIKTPINAALLLLNIGFSFYHAAYGIEEVIADYVPHKMTKILSVAFVKGLALILALICAYSVLYIAFS